MLSSIIECHAIDKIYGEDASAFHALTDIHVKINEGEMVAITGRSGSGKTTLMNIMGLLDIPTTGKLMLKGQHVPYHDTQRLAAMRNRWVGFVFQHYHLLPRLRVSENIGMPLWYRGLDAQVITKKVRAILSEMAMLSYMDAYPTELSGGQQQRVAIARALIGEPAFILADEPTGALDSQYGQMIMALLKRYHSEQGRTIVVITHDAEVAAACQREIQLKDGRIDEPCD